MPDGANQSFIAYYYIPPISGQQDANLPKACRFFLQMGKLFTESLKILHKKRLKRQILAVIVPYTMKKGRWILELLFNGRILTMEGGVRASAILTHEGRILAVGESEALAGKAGGRLPPDGSPRRGGAARLH